MIEPQEPHSAPTGHPSPDELSELAFSPEAAAAGLREHVEACLACTAELADLRDVLAALARLPEPIVPVSVGIRLDAAIARAWQEEEGLREPGTAADTGLRAAAGSTWNRRGALWRKLALPVGALCLLALGIVGAGKLIGGASMDNGAASSSAGRSVPGAAVDTALTQWVQSILPIRPTNGMDHSPVNSEGSPETPFGPECESAPAHVGYTELTTSQRKFDGQPATLFVYQNDQEPASRPLFAVVYAGSCPTGSSVILDEGFVSR